MHNSAFSYSLRRAYPYPWFSYLVWIGGFTALVLFSIINLVANGYTTSIIFTDNPNATEQPEIPAWYQKTPWSLASKTISSCQPQTISVGSAIYTTNLGLLYTIKSMFSVKENQTYPKVNMAYKNDAFHDCVVKSITLKSNDTQDYSNFRIELELSCLVYVATEPTTVAMTTSFGCFDAGLGDASLPSFINLDNKTQPGLFWGQMIVGLHTEYLKEFLPWLYDGVWMFGIQEMLPLPEDIMMEWSYYADNSLSPPVLSTPPEGFNLTTELWSSNYGQDVLERHWIIRSINDTLVPVFDLKDPFTSMAIYADGLIKAVRAVVLTDFGQSVSSNPFASPQKTLKFLNATLAFHQLTPSKDETDHTWPYLWGFDAEWLYHNLQIFDNMTAFYDMTGYSLPRVDPAYISTEYLCVVPKLKSVGSLIISVVIADLVFLRVLWAIFNWAVTSHLARTDPDAMICSGCLRSAAVGQELAVKGKNGYESVSNDNGADVLGTAHSDAT